MPHEQAMPGSGSTLERGTNPAPTCTAVCHTAGETGAHTGAGRLEAWGPATANVSRPVCSFSVALEQPGVALRLWPGAVAPDSEAAPSTKSPHCSVRTRPRATAGLSDAGGASAEPGPADGNPASFRHCVKI